LEGRYADGLVKLLVQLEGILIKRSRQTRRDPEYFRHKAMPHAGKGDGLRRMRDGHLPAKEEPVTEHVQP
jgi:hypothetical protein